MTSSGASELTICLNPAGLKRTLWWRERDSVVRHVDRSNYSHFRAVELPISCCAAAQPKAHHEKHTKKTRLQWLQGSFFAQGRCVCLVPLHRGRHVRPVEFPPPLLQGQAAPPRSVGLGGEAGLQTLKGVFLEVSRGGRPPSV